MSMMDEIKNIVTDKNSVKIVENDPYLQPYLSNIIKRQDRIEKFEKRLINESNNLVDFSNAHKYFGLHKTEENWIFREWAPNAIKIYMMGEFSNWKENKSFLMEKINDNGVFEIKLPLNSLEHLDYYKLKIHWNGGIGDRIPAYANYVTQDKKTHLFSARVWDPSHKYIFKNDFLKSKEAPIIYETHIGMAQIEGHVSTYKQFMNHTLPRIKEAGYNTVQIMAIAEHPYYGSFGYQVSSFFAPSSRFGTPDELKELIDTAHSMGLRVLMDIVHSHAVKNVVEGLSLFDGTQYQYFHDGEKGIHPAWDTMCFNYGSDQVTHYLLSNCKYWLEEFKFDGFRFDGVTSMLYHSHGHGKSFSTYNDYFNDDVDEDALGYLALANKLIHSVNKHALTIAEDISGMPGLAMEVADGGYGFDYRLGMGIPDFWIKHLKEVKDELWSVDNIFYELINRRKDESIISYAESHDQALVGDKTLIFWLLDKEMYENMAKNRKNLKIDRGISLHKLLRMLTISTARGGYLNFMGNEFGHPEWIDFPRKGNEWSYHYARRQWNLADDSNLCYEYLKNFDQGMISFIKENNVLTKKDPIKVYSHCDDQVIAYRREDLLFVVNLSGTNSYENYKINVPEEFSATLLFNSDEESYGGFSRVKNGFKHHILSSEGAGEPEYYLSLYLPARSALVYKLSN